MKIINVESPEPGDMADHKFRDLDPRPVAKVEGDQVWLQIGESIAGPVPVSNYSYTRVIESV